MEKKKVKRFIMKNQMNLAIGAISILAFIIGIFAIGFLKSFLIIGVIDLLLFAPSILKIIKKKGNRFKKTKTSTVQKIDNSKKITKSSKAPKEKKRKKKRKIFKKILIGFLILCILIGIAGCIAAGLFFMQIKKEAPKFDPHRLDRQESSIFYDVNGTEILKVGAQKREKITYDQMSENLINAIIATEDSRFFKHNGFDLPRFLKASINQLLGRGGGGASTLTMQVSKNNYTSTESKGWDGIKRKFTDIYMAMFQLEKTYTKKEIIEFYVNDNYLGGSAYGVEQASLTYFSKHAKDLNLAEAAMIAGLFQSPSGYDPFIHPEACEKRRQTVLYLMERHGYITSEERAIAKEMTVEKILNPFTETNDTGNEYMSFINLVISEIADDYDLDPYSTPMKVYTTLDTSKQDEINKILTGETYTWKNPVADARVAMIDTQTGAIAAVSNGRHNMYDKKTFNYVKNSNTQIGSTAKPLYDYGPAIEYLGWSTKELIVDEEHGYSSGGNVNNWDLKFMGMMTVQDALRMSRNIPAIKTFQSLNNNDVNTFVKNLHLHPENSGGIIHEAHSIGGYNGESPLSLAAAYNAFANGGYYVTPHSYTKIEFRETGEVQDKKVEKTRAMSEETAYMIMHMLIETPSYALGKFANIPGVTYGAKTGTTNFSDADFRAYNLPNGAVNDYWVVGSSPKYTISLWYGHKLSKENVAAGYVSKVNDYQHTLLFQKLGTALFEKGTSFTKPDGVIEVEIEKDSYPLALPSENTPSDMRTTALFKKGTEPTEASTRFNPTLDDVSNLKATVNKNKITLTWTGATIPTYSSLEGLRTNYRKLFKNDDRLEEYINNQLYYTNSYLGTFEYHIYRKNTDGSLTLMTKTTSNEVTFTDDVSGKNTYVVKSSYSIWTHITSNGAEVTLSVEGSSKPDEKPDDKPDDEKEDISILVNGSKNIKISEKNQFDETGFSYIMVTERIDGVLTDVTKKATIDVSHETFDYTKPGSTYKATLKVSYKKKTRTIELDITVES